MVAFLLLAHQAPAVDILVIEDPEHGLHPFLLGELVGILRSLAEGKLTGRPMHVVLTTHSPTVLDFSKPEELRVLNRQEDGSVDIVELPTDTEHWRQAFKVYDESLGQAWLSGGLGGTP
jgi:predicted ATP-dependent endonuclease of OLD family